MTKRLELGQSLLEVMVALAVATLALTALVSAVVVSVRNARFAKNQTLATKYAQEGIEKVRIYRDQNGWDTFWSDKVGSTEGPTTIATIFSKTVTYENVSSPLTNQDKVRVTVTVLWEEAGRSHQSELVTYLTRWE